MKSSLFIIICFCGIDAFSQVATISQTAYLGVPGETNRSGGAQNYYHYDLNQNLSPENNFAITDIDRVIPVSEKYSYKEFLDGNLIYTSGNQSQIVKMNFHLLYGEMKFIDPNGDTLFIANADTIAYVIFDKDLYQHDSQNGYAKILSGNDKIKLCSQQMLKLTEQRKSNNINLSYEHLVLSKRESYFLFRPTQGNCLANKSGFIKAFPTHEKQIETYLQQMARQRMPIKFYKEEDLIKLMNFCTSLI